MLERFQAHLARTQLIPEGVRVLVGYSGGPDSTCLLHLMHRSGIPLVAAHLHHGQRPEAEDELERCKGLAEGLSVSFAAGRADVPLLSKESGMGMEEAGRQARYHFFSRAAAQFDCGLIATAHTRTDLVETMLLNATRGCGLTGLAGIPERRNNIVRPLLPFSRDETVAYCVEHGLWTHDDPANTDLSLARARVRHRVLGDLRSINPRVEEALFRLAETAGDEDRFLNGLAAQALERAELPLNGELRFLTAHVEAAFSRATLAHLPSPLLRRALRLVAGALGAALSHDQTVAIERGLAEHPHGSVTAEGGAVVFEWDEARLSARPVTAPPPSRGALVVPGETSSELGWVIRATEVSCVPEKPPRAALQAAIDPSKLRGPLFFRSAQAGDEMTPLGFDRHRKLADLLAGAKLTLAARSRLPIVCDLAGPLWAPGVCLDGRASASSGTTRAVLLRFAAVSNPASHN